MTRSSEAQTSLLEKGGWTFDRVLGRFGGERPGPTVVVLGGVHGNEPAGAYAAQRVVTELERLRPRFRGQLVALAGNLAALERGCRFVDRDLNRRWFNDEIAALRERDPARDSVEDRSQRELLEIFDTLMAESDRPVVFLDLHTTSGEGPPFACMSDTLRNRRIALALPVPVILGLEEVIDGSMLGYLSDLGHCGVAIEGGQHRGPDTIAAHVAAIWLVLVTTGAVDAAEVPDLDRFRRQLASGAESLPRVVEIRHRHVVEPGDGFVMESGWSSFEPLEAGEVVARDDSGPIAAPASGRMLLPRYQGQGEDGYFVARDIRPAWLRVSSFIRTSGLDRWISLLPGISRHPALDDHLVVDTSIARWYSVEVMHMCGYRRRRAEGDRLVFSRRRPDDARPLRPARAAG